MKKKRVFIKLIIILLVLGAVIAFLAYQIYKNPRYRILASVVGLSENTMRQENNILYDIDIMEVCSDYMNSDTSIEGKLYLEEMQGFNYSTDMEVSGKRSFEQKQLLMNCDMNVLFFNIGEVDFYEKDETIYTVFPILEDLAYAFDTKKELFKKAPSLSSDIDREWFHEHKSDIVEMMQDVSIEETGIETINNSECKGYIMTIPKGSGEFIWELLGIDSPDYDISMTLYLSGFAKIERVDFDTSEMLENTSLVLEGENLSECIFTANLPDDELLIVKMQRNEPYEIADSMDIEATYRTYKNETFNSHMKLLWTREDNSYSIKVREASIKQNDKVLCNMTFVGSVKKDSFEKDIFADIPYDLNTFETLDWREVRDDTKGFLDDVKEEALKRL